MSFLSNIFKRWQSKQSDASKALADVQFTLANGLRVIETNVPESSDDEFAFDCIKTAEKYEEQGKIDLAISAYREAIKKARFNDISYRALILLLEKVGRFEEAINVIDEYIDGRPDYSPEKVIFIARRERLKNRLDGIVDTDSDRDIVVNIETFKDKYKESVPFELSLDMTEASIDGKTTFAIKKSIYDEIVLAHEANERFNKLLGAAVANNNDGIALEKAGDIAGAIEKFEQNILPDTYFTLHPYHRLCVLYRRAGDYDNEIRVIETCLARPEWKSRQYNESKELAFFEDRLVKAKKYREQHQQK